MNQSKILHIQMKTGNMFFVFFGLFFLSLLSVKNVSAQIPTVNIPTVTGTDQGVVVTVKNDQANPQINVRSGPGTEYDKVGTMVISQKAVAKGRTEGGNWLLIEYSGGPGGYAWVYASYVIILVICRL